MIRCRDALSLAMNWLEPPEPPDVKRRFRLKLQWLNKRLDEATVLADWLAADEGKI